MIKCANKVCKFKFQVLYSCYLLLFNSVMFVSDRIWPLLQLSRISALATSCHYTFALHPLDSILTPRKGWNSKINSQHADSPFPAGWWLHCQNNSSWINTSETACRLIDLMLAGYEESAWGFETIKNWEIFWIIPLYTCILYWTSSFSFQSLVYPV